MEILPQTLPGPSLVRDYLAGEPRAAGFYAGHPADLHAFTAKWAAVRERFDRPARERAAAALTPTSPRAAERLRRFVEEGGAVVTTGQQAGFLTGPLYTIYKALTTVRLARTLEEALGIVVLPVFWTASEDHDWEEANHAFLLGPDGEPHRLALPDADPRPLPMSERTLTAAARPVLDGVAQSLAGTLDGDRVLQWILAAYRPGATVAAGFSELLARMLAPYDVLLTDAADPALKRASVPVLRGALVEAGAQERLVRERCEAIEEAGYHLQVALLPGATNVFYGTESGRERLYRRGEGWVTHETREVLDAERVRAELETDPARFSPNVLLRPVVESSVFPTLAYVGGPGEISYFAQLAPLFGAAGLEPPVVVPRFSAVLVEPGVRRALEGLGMSIGELRRPRSELVTRLAREALPEGVRSDLAAAGEGIAEGFGRLLESAEEIDPTLRGAVGRLRNEALTRLAEAELRIVRAVKRRGLESIRRMELAQGSLFPLGEPQERVLNVVPFLARHGTGLLREIHDAIPDLPLLDAPAPEGGARYA